MQQDRYDYDPRAVANTLLHAAWKQDIELTNLSLQKLLYFCHGFYLIKHKRPLVTGYFEAWPLGPVHPSVYQSFKENQDAPIGQYATEVDIRTRARRAIPVIERDDVKECIDHVLQSFGRMSASQLVRLSHAKNSPWDIAVNKSTNKQTFFARISGELISANFKFHKFSLDEK